MKNQVFILLIILLNTYNSYSQNFWEKTNGLDNIIIYSLAINSNGDIFAGADTSYGVFRSTDNGDNWLELGLDTLKTTGIVIKPSGEILLITLDHYMGGGVFHSLDNGNNWTALEFTNAGSSIAINSSGDIFVGTLSSGVYRSTDDGSNWIQINQGLTDTHPLSLAIKSSGEIFVGTINGVFRSTDNGDNWVLANQGITNNQILSLGINSNGNLFAGTSGGGVYRSTDNGSNWIQINQGLTITEGLYVYSIAINSNGDIFAGTADGVFRSADNGNNWVQINQGLTNLRVNSLAINSNGGIFAGTLDGVFRSLITANLKVYLEGPYAGGGAMTTTLNTNNLIPLNSNTAYSTSTYGYTASTVTSIPNSDIVDWVLVELRTGTAAGTKVATRAAFLKSDGSIVDTNGVSPLQFAGLGDGNYYVVVRHRNHLAIMTASAIPLSSNSVLYDFSTAQLQAYGTNPMADLLGNGTVFGMWMGDTDGSGVVDVTDRANTWNLRNTSGVNDGSDTDLSSVIDVTDRANTWNNRNRQTQVPN